MTELQKEAYLVKLKRLCEGVVRSLANVNGLEITKRHGQLQIVGPEGYISSAPHGEDFHSDFEPGHGTESDWARFFKRGVLSLLGL